MTPDTQNVTTPRKPPESIQFELAIADEIREVAGKLGLPYGAVRDVVANFGTDVLERKVQGQVAKIFKAHIDGLLPPQVLTRDAEGAS